MATTREIAIVGGGIAGLAAARVLARHGVAATLYEASDRLGGRVVTIEMGHELPVELGPEFIQGQPRATLDLVREAGRELEIEGISETHHLWSAGRLVEIDEFWERLRPLLDHAGALSSDRSARDFLATEQATPDGARLFAMMVEGIYAAPLEDISVESVVADAGGPGASSDQARLRRGYGRLVRWLAGEIARLGVVVRPGFAATRIDWRRDRVEIAAIDRVALADAVIVTVPLGVLASDAIHFEPDLGAAHRAALTRLAMGQVVKLVLCVGGELPGEAGRENLAFVHAYDTPFPTFWVRTLGDASRITMWAAGPHAIALAGLAADQLAERAVDQLATTLRVPRGRLAARIMHRHFHDFAQDPFARGAYSHTRVGGMQAAATLSRPLGDRVFLAGEATDSDYEGSVAGAIASGTRAAEQVLRVAA
jgi:monoamine oxidase